MAKAATKEGASKSELTRKYVKANPAANPKAIVEGMKAEGVDISLALANKIKYDPARKGGAKKGRRKKKVAGRRAAASKNGVFDKGNKAEAIRQAARSIGGKVRPKEVIAMLSAEGIKVSSAQVSTTLKRMGMKRTRRGRKVGAVAAPRAASRSESISLDDLIAAKRLVEKVGGVEAASQALSALAKLS